MRILRRAGYETRPWRNGGGVSHEVAWHADDDWRLSLAEITRPGPFSDYAGFERTLTPIGEGLRLNGAPVGPAPHAFDGAEAVHAALDHGPVLAFNVITRRGAARHAVERLALDAPREVAADFVFVLAGALALDGAALHALDCAETRGSVLRAVPETRAELAIVRLLPP